MLANTRVFELCSAQPKDPLRNCKGWVNIILGEFLKCV